MASLTWVVCLAGVIGAYYFFRRLQFLEDTPQSLIRSAAQGYVEMQGSGRLMPGQPILAPLTRVPCLWWSYRIEERAANRRGRANWSCIDRDVSGELFLLQDASGQCVVDPDQADVYPSTSQTWYGDSPLPEGGPALGKFAMVSRYRYTEQRMQDGDPLYALGYFHTQGPESHGEIDEEVRQLLVRWKQDQPWLLRQFDKDRDGQVDAEEWEAARQEARRIVLEQEREALARPPVNLLSRPPDDRPYILSTVPQQRLELRMRVYVAACLLALLLAGAVGTRLLSVRLSAPPADGSHSSP